MRVVLLAGLMAATALTGAVPAVAQVSVGANVGAAPIQLAQREDRRGDRGRGGEARGNRGQGDGNAVRQSRQEYMQRGSEAQVQQRAERRAERVEARAQQRVEAPQAPAQVDRSQMQQRNWQGGDRDARGEGRTFDGNRQRDVQRQVQQQQTRPGFNGQGDLREARRVDRQVDRREDRRDIRDDRRDDRQEFRGDRREDRRDFREDRRDDRQDFRGDRRDDRRDFRNDRRDDRTNWTNNGYRNDRNDRNNSYRRLNERERWSNQNRWNNGWRNDRRYDWQRHRQRYSSYYRLPRYYAPYGWNYGYRRFSVGIQLSSLLFSSSYWINDPYEYRLPPAYGTLRWIRYYDDALLVDVRDGYVVDVINDFFY